MNLTDISARLESARIDNLEKIARHVSASRQEDFNSMLAKMIVEQKLEESGLSYEPFYGEFPYVINENGGAVVSVAPELVIPDQRKNAVQKYARQIRREMDDNSGVIQFMPFQMNGKKLRNYLKDELPIQFVNLPYDKKSLERRFYEYCRPI